VENGILIGTKSHLLIMQLLQLQIRTVLNFVSP